MKYFSIIFIVVILLVALSSIVSFVVLAQSSADNKLPTNVDDKLPTPTITSVTSIDDKTTFIANPAVAVDVKISGIGFHISVASLPGIPRTDYAKLGDDFVLGVFRSPLGQADEQLHIAQRRLLDAQRELRNAKNELENFNKFISSQPSEKRAQSNDRKKQLQEAVEYFERGVQNATEGNDEKDILGVKRAQAQFDKFKAEYLNQNKSYAEKYQALSAQRMKDEESYNQAAAEIEKKNEELRIQEKDLNERFQRTDKALNELERRTRQQAARRRQSFGGLIDPVKVSQQEQERQENIQSRINEILQQLEGLKNGSITPDARSPETPEQLQAKLLKELDSLFIQLDQSSQILKAAKAKLNITVSAEEQEKALGVALSSDRSALLRESRNLIEQMKDVRNHILENYEKLGKDFPDYLSPTSALSLSIIGFENQKLEEEGKIRDGEIKLENIKKNILDFQNGIQSIQSAIQKLRSDTDGTQRQYLNDLLHDYRESFHIWQEHFYRATILFENDKQRRKQLIKYYDEQIRELEKGQEIFAPGLGATLEEEAKLFASQQNTFTPAIYFDEHRIGGGLSFGVRMLDERTLVASIPPSLLTPGAHMIRVENTTFYFGFASNETASSNLYPITVVPANSPAAKNAAGIPRPSGYQEGAPIISHIDLEALPQGASGVPITVFGGNFSAGTRFLGRYAPVALYINGVQVPAKSSEDFKSFSAVVPGEFLRAEGTLDFSVVNQSRNPSFPTATSPVFKVRVVSSYTPPFFTYQGGAQSYRPGVPVIVAVDPPYLFAKSPDDVLMRITGGGFSTALQIQNLATGVTTYPLVLDFNGTVIPSPSSGNSEEFLVTVPAKLLQNPGIFKLAVVSGGRSSPVLFSVIEPPTPKIIAFPKEILHRPPQYRHVEITGSGFLSSDFTSGLSAQTVVELDGSPLPGSAISDTEIRVLIPQSFFETSRALGTHQFVVVNEVHGRRIASASVSFQVVSTLTVPPPVETGGGNTGAIPVKYTSQQKPVISSAKFERISDGTIHVRVTGEQFLSNAQVIVNDIAVPTVKEGDGLIGTVSAVDGARLVDTAVKIKVINPGGQIKFAAKNVTAPATMFAVRNGVETRLETKIVDGGVEVIDTTTLPKGLSTFYLETGSGSSKARSPGQEIEVR